jgi:hypothetical protein
MTGKEWSEHFKALPPEKRIQVVKALMVLHGDSGFRKAYGYQFMELATIATFPLDSTHFDAPCADCMQSVLNPA